MKEKGRVGVSTVCIVPSWSNQEEEKEGRDQYKSRQKPALEGGDHGQKELHLPSKYHPIPSCLNYQKCIMMTFAVDSCF
jgi:hypothetical protein